MKFNRNTMYELIDFDGLVSYCNSINTFQMWLPHHIKKSGNTILVLDADSYGNAFGFELGNGVVYGTTYLNATLSKFFKPVEPLCIKAGHQDIVDWDSLCLELFGNTRPLVFTVSRTEQVNTHSTSLMS